MCPGENLHVAQELVLRWFAALHHHKGSNFERNLVSGTVIRISSSECYVQKHHSWVDWQIHLQRLDSEIRAENQSELKRVHRAHRAPFPIPLTQQGHQLASQLSIALPQPAICQGLAVTFCPQPVQSPTPDR